MNRVNTERVFISIPMRGRTNDEIVKHFNLIKEKLEKMGYEVADSYNSNFYSELIKQELGNNKIHHSLQALGFSLTVMSTCDIVFFGKGWKDARGCRIEHEAAKRYGLKTIYESELDNLVY